MRRLVAHIGSHKTGTTAVQSLLNVVDDEITDLTGLTYVRVEPGRRAAVKPDTQTSFRASGAALRPAFDDRLAQLDTDCLVVEEQLSWIFDRREIHAMLDRLERTFDDIRIIVYLRRQDRHMVSHYQQAARLRRTAFFGAGPTALPEYEPHHDRYLDYHARLAPYVERLGLDRVTMRVYERDLLVDSDVTADFLAQIGVDRGRLPPVGRVHGNVSLGKTATKLGHLYNEIPNRQLNSRVLSAALPNDAKLMPARHRARAIVQRYEASNERLAELFGLEAPVFPTGFDDFPARSNGPWTSEEIVAALGGLRRLTIRIGREQGIDVGSDVFPRSVRVLRRQAQDGRLPSEKRVNDRLRLVLARVNALALGDAEWRNARPGAD